tara:strand:- start:11196 stop:11513 length:318 start_codon:yes stop_codon:yes gene_type:complete
MSSKMDVVNDFTFISFGNYWDKLSKSFEGTDKKEIAEMIICAWCFEVSNEGYKYEKLLDIIFNGLKTYHQVEIKNSQNNLKELRNKIESDRMTIAFGNTTTKGKL